MKRTFLLLIALFSIQLHAAKKITVPAEAHSIKAALELAESGDTVFVKNGTYRGRITLKDEVLLLGESADSTILKGSGHGPVVIGASNAVIRNFTIKDGEKGILCENVFMTIEHNVICKNRGSGIHCLLALPAIRNNIIYQNGWSGIFCETVRSLRFGIENNIIAENNYSGLVLKGNSEVVVQNNVFLQNKQFGIWETEEARRSRVVFNDFFMNRSPFKGFSQLDATNVAADPQYYFGDSPALIFSKPSEILRGRGKDGATIGLLTE